MIHSQVIVQRNKNICPQKILCKKVCSSLFHNSPKLETTDVIKIRMGPLWCRYTMEYYLCIKENKQIILHHLTDESQNTILNERCHTERIYTHMISLIWNWLVQNYIVIKIKTMIAWQVVIDQMGARNLEVVGILYTLIVVWVIKM